ncbi:MAG: MJ0042-type zinc finger domain-containing protein [Planctomycetota bacterium]
MKTVCSHCNKWFEVSDKALGKNARCRSCGKVFVIAPAPLEHDDPPPPRQRQDAPPAPPPRREPVQSDDPLEALADAAEQSGYERMAEVSEHAREHGSSVSRRARGEVGGMAKGAVPSVIFGSIGVAIALVVLILAILVGADIIPLNAVSIILLFGGLCIASIVCLVGIVQGGTTRKRIRRAKGTLDGKGAATTGIALGWSALALALAAGTTLLIIITRTGGIVLEQRIVE